MISVHTACISFVSLELLNRDCEVLLLLLPGSWRDELGEGGRREEGGGLGRKGKKEKGDGEMNRWHRS